MAQLCFQLIPLRSEDPREQAFLPFRLEPGWDQGVQGIVATSLTSHLLEFRLAVKNLGFWKSALWVQMPCSDILTVEVTAGTVTPTFQGYSHVAITIHQNTEQHMEFGCILICWASLPAIPLSIQSHNHGSGTGTVCQPVGWELQNQPNHAYPCLESPSSEVVNFSVLFYFERDFFASSTQITSYFSCL